MPGRPDEREARRDLGHGPAEPEVITAQKVEGEEGAAAAPGDKKAAAPAKGAAPAAKDAKPAAGGDKKK